MRTLTRSSVTAGRSIKRMDTLITIICDVLTHHTYLLGILLFSSYFCRPTSALFIAVVFLYLFIKKRELLSKVLLTCVALMGVFIVFSWIEYKQYLPDYYLSKQLGARSTFWWAMYGHLVSPSKGLLILSPYLIVPIIGGISRFRHISRSLLFWLAGSWLCLHWIVISRNEAWYGGGTFGTRMFTDVIPALLLLTLLIGSHTSKELTRVTRRFVVGLFILLTGISIYIHRKLNKKVNNEVF